MAARTRTGLVLGGGGVVGGAWMVGALKAIQDVTGWRPATADYLVGTSAGAMVAALLASELAPSFLVTQSLAAPGDALPPPRAPAEGGAGRAGSVFRLQWSFPRPVLGSPELALRSLREPWRYGPAGIIGWLPRGVISTEPLKAVINRLVPSGWSQHSNLWIPAVDYRTGECVVFGSPGAPAADLADAVAASCAVPGLYHPVTINRRLYVDGGIRSASNLDILMGSDAELVVCLNPMSSIHVGHGLSPAGRVASLVRGNIGRRLADEARGLRRIGKTVLLVQPAAEDLEVMGFNYMSSKRRNAVIETAVMTTTRALRQGPLGPALRQLADGPTPEPARPAGPRPQWPADLPQALTGTP